MHIFAQRQPTATERPSMGHPERWFINAALIGGLFACEGFGNIWVKGKFLSSISIYAPVRTVSSPADTYTETYTLKYGAVAHW